MRYVLAAALCLLAVSSANAQGIRPRVSLNADDKPLLAALRDIFGQAGAQFKVDGPVIAAVEASKVTISLTSVPLDSAVDSMLRSTRGPVPLGYRMEDGQFVIIRSSSVGARPVKPQPDDGGLHLKRVEMELLGKTVKELLDHLFKSVGSDYALHPSVQERFLQVKVDRYYVKDMPFVAALEDILRRSDAPLTHTVVSGKYAILAAPRTSNADPRGRFFEGPTNIQSTLPAVLKIAMGQLGQNYVLALPAGDVKVSLIHTRLTIGEAVDRMLHSNPNLARIGQEARGGIYIVGPGVRGPANPPPGQRFWGELKDVDLRWALASLFTACGESFSLDKNVAGTVTVSLEGGSLDQALAAVVKAAKSPVPLRYRLENKKYIFEGVSGLPAIKQAKP